MHEGPRSSHNVANMLLRVDTSRLLRRRRRRPHRLGLVHERRQRTIIGPGVERSAGSAARGRLPGPEGGRRWIRGKRDTASTGVQGRDGNTALVRRHERLEDIAKIRRKGARLRSRATRTLRRLWVTRIQRHQSSTGHSDVAHERHQRLEKVTDLFRVLRRATLPQIQLSRIHCPATPQTDSDNAPQGPRRAPQLWHQETCSSREQQCSAERWR